MFDFLAEAIPFVTTNLLLAMVIMRRYRRIRWMMRNKFIVLIGVFLATVLALHLLENNKVDQDLIDNIKEKIVSSNTTNSITSFIPK